ncbi:MAG: glycoside hydrolase family 3 N-terminal domain-containing protein [Rhodoglobus sp.]
MANAGVRRVLGCAALALVTALAGCTAAAPLAEPRRASDLVPHPVDPIELYADARLSVMTLDQKIGSMLMVHVPGLDVGSMAAFAAQNQVGGLILMGDNVPEPADQLAWMTPAMSPEPGLPLLLGIDQEGGIVRRIDTDVAASAQELRFLDPSAARDAFASRAALLASLGVSVNFGIVADVTGDPESFIYDRSMGATAVDAAARVAAAVEGERGTVLSTLKHFPGHGVSPGDSHSSIPTTAITLDEWRVDHEPPFAAGINAGAEFVMMGHLQFDAVDAQPATLSPLWHQLLREELGFEGLIITDDMAMLLNSGRPDLADPYQNAVRAAGAGNTMLLYVGAIDVPRVVAAIRDAVLAGTIDESIIDDAARRILVARRTLSGETGPFVHCFDECQAVIQ